MKHRFLILTLAALATSAQAQVLKDPQWQAWLDTSKTAELTQAALGRLSAHPDDAQAAVALALAAVDEGQPARLDAVVKPLQACIERTPPQAACFYALGTVQGAQAMSGGMMAGLRLATKVKDNLSRAVELDPQLFEARQALSQFYLVAPGIAGGSVSKARELAAAAQARQPEHAKLLRAQIALQDKQWAEVVRELQSVRPGDDRFLAIELRQTWAQLGTGYFSDKQFFKARGVFEQLMRDAPTQALGPYGLARVMTETAQPDEAVKLLDRARGLEGADKLPIDHRLGIALLAKGDKPQAKAALERFVASKKPNPRNLEDARKRLAELS
jgi:tetratricopeptide (TPR) repeat protein